MPSVEPDSSEGGTDSATRPGGSRSEPSAGPGRIYGLLSVVSVVQFTTFAFFTFGLVAILRRRGVGLDVLGLVQLAQVVPAIRFIWAPLVDRYGAHRGHYRSWLAGLIVPLVVAALIMSRMRPEGQLEALVALVVVAVALSATMNVATDALTVTALDERRRGIANGLRTAGAYVGTLLSGGLLLVIYDHVGWGATVLTFAALPLLSLPFLVGVGEPLRRSRLDGPLPRHGFGYIASLLRQPGAARWALGALSVYCAGPYAAAALIDPMLVDAHWSLSWVGLAINVPSELAALCCGVLAGWLLTRLGSRCALLVGGIWQVVAVSALLPLAFGVAPRLPTMLAVCAVKSSYAISATVVLTISMRFCRPRSAGTDAAAIAVTGSVVTAVAGAVVLPIAHGAGYVTTVASCVVVAGIGTLVAHRLCPRPVSVVGKPAADSLG